MSMGLITLARIARLLAVSESSVLRWSHAGSFPAPVILPDGRRRWRRSEVAAWMGGLGQCEEAKQPPSLPKLARDMLQALQEGGGWASAEELAGRIGGGADHTTGYWGRVIKKLRGLGLIESSRSHGYRLKPGAMVPM